LYGVARDDIPYVMDSFPIVREKDMQEYGSYRTCDLILQYYNALAAGDMEARVQETKRPARRGPDMLL